MLEFPPFLKSPSNRIATSSQFTDDIEGYLFDGADGSQVAFWTARQNRMSAPHTHDFDEYLFLIEGNCSVHIDGQHIQLRAGDEFFIPTGTQQQMGVTAGTRTVHVFGGRRARREEQA